MGKYLKNKKLGFYFVLADILLAIVLAVVFFATYKAGNGNGQLNMANKAYAAIPEVIGIFAIVGAVVDIAALALPEYSFIHIVALVCYCISLGKEIYTIPDIIVGVANGIAYEGGNFPLNIFWLVLQFLIIGLGIAALFIGFMKEDEEEVAKKEKIAGNKLIKVIAVAAAGVLAIGAGVISTSVLKSAANKAGQNDDDKKKEAEEAAFREKWAPLVDESYDEEHDWKDFKLSEADNQYAKTAANTIKSKVGTNLDKRDGFYKVYEFEGATAEGWQGDYSLKKGFLSLWNDGLYNGTSNGSAIYGYWYNVDVDGSDCLVLISKNDSNNMVCNKLAGDSTYYEWSVDMIASYNGGRMIKVNGLKYTPVIGIYIDTGDDPLEYKTGDTVNTSEWPAMQVRNNLVRGSIFDAEHDVKWSNTKITAAAGETQTLKASWTKEGVKYETEVEVKVVE